MTNQAPEQKSISDRTLLRRYTQQESDDAFAALTARHRAMVYATCLRDLNDAALAEDATQTVFLILTRKASSLRNEATLAAWLYKTARLVCRNIIKQEVRARRRTQRLERQMMIDASHGGANATDPWEMIDPALNEALSSLPRKDLDLILLRFFEDCSLQETGAALGVSEDAARMRIGRALEKMRRLLAKNGVAVPALALGAILAEHSSHPAEAAASTTGAVGLPSAHIQTYVQETLKEMLKTKLIYAALITVGMSFTCAGGLVALGKNKVVPAARPIAAAHKKAAVKYVPANVNQLNQMRLTGDFTLTYTVYAHDMRTPELLKAERDQQIGEVDKQVASGQYPGDGARLRRETEEAYRAPRPDTRASVTLSGHAGKLLVQSVSAVPSNDLDAMQTMIFDGNKLYQTGRRDYIGIYNDGDRKPGARYHDENVGRLAFTPMPGIGLPGMDLVQSPTHPRRTKDNMTLFDGAIPRFGLVAGGESPYNPGQITVTTEDGRLRVVSTLVGSSAKPRMRWELSDFRLLKEHWIAGRMRQTIYEELPIQWKTSAPPVTWQEDFQLTQASAHARELSAFAPETYLDKGANISDIAFGLSSGQFTYDPAAGTIAEQIQRARASEKK
ncbi:MAG: sigma-70 family RNA polymerase sigma factor [Capsulimonas sp.]|uniref:RNA polymerase sigma factor n=1 Tax=Capsulimonas sp. TaxID=2494211 RepID=UPI0032660CC2